MIPAIDLARAEERQRTVHSQRQNHRDCLKEIEAEDQALKRLIRAGRLLEEAMTLSPPHLLAALALEPVPSAPVAKPIAFVPALDHAPEPVAAAPKPVARSVPTPAPAQPKPAAAPAPPLGSPLARIIALGDEILVMLKEEREGSTSSIEMADLVRSTGMSETSIKLAIDNLVSRGLVKSARKASRDHVTVIITEAAA